MRNFVCWDSNDVYEIINPDADALPDYIFAAVHTDSLVPLRLPPKAQPVHLSGKDLIKKFLDPSDHVLTAVVGESGTGKSHLIRWLKIWLPPNDHREVIFVPKARTNLREIVKELAYRLPDDEKNQILKELQETGDTHLETSGQRHAILNALHTSLANDESVIHAPESEIEEFLNDGLKSIFLDDHLRESYLLHDDRFAADLADHVFERPASYQPTEQRRKFTVNDLPLDIANTERSGAKAQEFLSYLLQNTSDHRSTAVNIVDRHIDRVISRCLNFSGDRLIELMFSIRRKLLEDGKELILLIEDFARLQGLDRALLQSVIEQHSDLCVLRTAFACTSGFYQTVEHTVQTRLTFVVDMSAESTESDYNGLNLVKFTANYMNALRLGTSSLEEIYSESSEIDEKFSITSRCDKCSEIDNCHQAFGSVDGIGLYPFTERAINNMSKRVDEETRQHFPRTFQTHILRPITLLEKSIKRGTFPDKTLLKSLGGKQSLPAIQLEKLRNSDPKNWERRETLLLLWEDSQTAKNLSNDIQSAFGLEYLHELEKEVDPKGRENGTENGREKDPDTGKNQELDPRIEELEEWFNGSEKLSQSTTNDLRRLIFEVVKEFIDWDNIGISVKHVIESKTFQPTSFYIFNQSRNPVKTDVFLTIPSDWNDRNEKYQTMMAFQMLFESEKKQNWKVDGISEKISCLLERLRDWSRQVILQLREIESFNDRYNALEAAFTTRVFLSQLTNSNLNTNSTLDLVTCGLKELGESVEFVSPKLTELVSKVREQDEFLKDMIFSRCSSMKGSAIGSFKETYKLVKFVQKLQDANFVPAPLPDDLSSRSDDMKKILDIRRVLAKLRDAVEEEINLRQKWLIEMNRFFGENTTKKQILEITQKIIDMLGHEGVLQNQQIAQARHAFHGTNYDNAIKSTRNLAGSKMLMTLNELSVSVVESKSASVRLIEELQTTLGSAEHAIEMKVQLKEHELAQLKQENELMGKISSNLAQIAEEVLSR